MLPIRVLVWNEGLNEKLDPEVCAVYPAGIHAVIADGLRETLGQSVVVATATLEDDVDHGLSAETLEQADVLVWWGHRAHDKVRDDVVERVRQRVLAGMGLVVLHSAHFSKIFVRLMGTTCSLSWRNVGERELVWTVKPSHPIAQGIDHPIIFDHQEMYGELFDIPEPDDLIFISSFAGGEVFRSGVTFTRGLGRIFYFSPGDEHYPLYYHPQIRRVIANGVQWVRRQESGAVPEVANRPSGWYLPPGEQPLAN